MIINQNTRLFWRIGLIALTIPSSLIGFAGIRVTTMHLNGQRQELIAQENRLEKAEQHEEVRKALLTAEANAQKAEAEAYTELGLRQAHCGSTLSKFYFQPGIDVVEQLNNWGFDWKSPKYNTNQWFPLYDSNGLLFAAIRENGLVQSDITPMDQAAICNFNKLTMDE